MKVKTISAWSDKGFDKKINEFLSDASLEVMDIKFATPIFFYTALILYK